MNRVWAACIAIVLAGCKGVPGSDASTPRALNERLQSTGICSLPLGGGMATIELRQGPLSQYEYNSIRSEDLEQAIDRDEATYAIIESLISPREDVTLTATAQDGVVYPGGVPAAVIAELHGGGYLFEGEVRTLLRGVLQETARFQSSGEDGVQTLRIETTAPFDAMELHFTNINGRGADVYEFCAEAATQ